MSLRLDDAGGSTTVVRPVGAEGASTGTVLIRRDVLRGDERIGAVSLRLAERPGSSTARRYSRLVWSGLLWIFALFCAVMLLDLHLPDASGLDILARVRDAELSVSVVIIIAHGTVGSAVEVLQAGAVDFLEKPIAKDRLVVTVRNFLDRQRLSVLVREYEDLAP
jgi:CheY-like chemotaxis protein